MVTAATDSAFRIWDVEARQQHRDIIVHKAEREEREEQDVCGCLGRRRGREEHY